MITKTLMTGTAIIAAGIIAAGCGTSRMMPFVYMPDPPKECQEVMDFQVEPLPSGKSNGAKLSVDMAKEGAIRQKEHETSRVCAEYALRTAGVMKDKDKPDNGSPKPVAAGG